MKVSHWIISLAFLMMVTIDASAQSFGVRAGLNYSTLNGPKLAGESYDLSSGFHFGINYTYHFSDVFGLRAEIGYTQNGNKYAYEGESFYIVRTTSSTTFEKGNLQYNIDNSLGYLGIPVVLDVKLTPKWSVHAGLYANFLMSPVGKGELRFESASRPEDFTFRQALDYQYSKDRVQGGRNGTINPKVRIGDDLITLNRFAGAYNQYAEKDGNLFNGFDGGITAGVDYFINKGFFIGLSGDLGLVDLTNNEVDFQRDALDENNTFRFSDDRDTHIGLKLSIGFRF